MLKLDAYHLAINCQENYEYIAGVLKKHGSCLVSWTDGEVQFDILFNLQPGYDYNQCELQGGIYPTYLFVSIMGMGAFAFKTRATSHGDYYAEKLGLQFDGGTRQALGKLINGVRALL